jgi:DNA-binding GntR family transcriptional regulator
VTTAFKPISARPEKLTEMVFSEIREAIVSRRLAPGDQLSEASVAAQLRVSKTPVREALLKLEYVGLIESGPWRGLRVVMPSGDAIRSAYEVRTAVEAQAVRILAERAEEEDLRRIQTAADECFRAAESYDREGFRDGDRRFHLGMADAIENPLLTRLIHDAFDLTWTLRRRDVPDPDASLECAAQHLTVIEGILAGDPDLAEKAIRDHLRKVQGLVLAAYYAHGNS